MKVLALIEAPGHVCWRYRVQSCATALAERGWMLESLPLSPHTFSRRTQLRQTAAADVVILQRKLLPLWQIHLLRRYANKLIYDVDDALFCRDSYAAKGSNSWARLAAFWATVYTADAVTAGNEFLCEQTRQYVPTEKVHLLRTCLDPSRYPVREHRADGRPLRLVWIGQASTLPCLGLAHRYLRAAAANLPQLRLRVICDRFPELDGLHVEPCVWSEQTEVSDVAGGDIGISWLPDDLWSRGKCGLKVLQYMAAGLPVVANPVGMNRQQVVHGETGFLAETPREWADAIGRLAADPDLRQRMGQAGREKVQREYSLQQWAPRLASLVESLGHPLRQEAPAPGIPAAEKIASD